VGQGLPVLEDVSPVARIAAERAARAVAGLDREAIPGPARVAVAAAEAEWHVFGDEAGQLGVAAAGGLGHHRVAIAAVGPLGPLPVPVEHGPAAAAEKGRQIARRAAGAVGRQAAPHDVEERVRRVVGGGDLIGGDLHAIGGGDAAPQAVGLGGEGRLEFRSRVRGRSEPVPQVEDRRLIEPAVDQNPGRSGKS
jgi:hypothetical protein